MSDTYTVRASLDMKSNVPEVMAQMARSFREINDLIKDTQAGIGRFAADLRELTSGSRGVNNLVRGFKQLSEMKMGAGMLGDLDKMAELTRSMAESQRELAEASRETARALREAAAVRPPTQRPVNPNKPAPAGHGTLSHGDLMDAGIGLQMGGDAGTSFLEKAVMANFEVEHLLTQFRQNTAISDSDMNDIRAKAESLARSVPGTQIAENLHSLLDLYTITGNIGEALKASDTYAKTKLVLSSLPGAHHGDSAYAAGQSIEVMQRFYDPKTHAVDLNAFNQQLAAMTQVAVGTGGRVDGSTYLGFAKQARMGGMLANDQFLYQDAPAMLIALGGSRAGTGDAATFRQFAQGRMTKNAFGELEQTGLIDKKATWHGGQVHDMSKHLMGADEFVENPVQWVRDVLLPQLKRKGINTNDRAALGLAISQWASTATGLGFLSEMALGMPGIDKEGAKIRQTSSNPMATILKNDPMQQLREFNAAENELLVTLGKSLMGPAIESLKALTGVLHDLSDWSKAHPDASKHILEVAGASAIISKALGDVAMAFFIAAPVAKVIGALTKSLMPFGAGGEAEVALATMAGTGAGSIAALGVSLVGLAGALAYTSQHVSSVYPNTHPDQPETSLGKGLRSGFFGPLLGGIAAVYGDPMNWFSSHPPSAGGTGGKDASTQALTLNLTNNTVVDGKVVQKSVTQHIVKAMRSNAGPAGGDKRRVPTPPGATDQ